MGVSRIRLAALVLTSGIVLSGFRRIARGQVADSKDSFAVLTFRTADVLMPHALLDTDCASLQVHVPPCQSEHFRDPPPSQCRFQ